MSAPTAELGETLDPAFADYLLDLITAALPAFEDATAGLARRAAIRAALLAMRPRGPVEAMLAAEVIGAHHVIMDCFRLALRSDTDPAEAARARGSAAALSRVRLATLRLLAQREAPAEPAARPAPPARRRPAAIARPPAAPDPIAAMHRPEPAEPALELEPAAPEASGAERPEPPPAEPPPAEPPRFTPRDRFGHPIERFRWEDMTMAQRRAAFSDPSDVAAREAALAEEAAAIAAELALQAVADGPDPGAVPLTPRPTAPS